MKYILYEIQRIGQQISFDSLFGYVIDGISDDSVDKILLRSARDINDFKSKLDEYERHTRCTRQTMPKRQVRVNGRKDRSRKRWWRGGHAAKRCPEITKGSKRFKCGVFGHISKACNQTTKTEIMCIDNKSTEMYVVADKTMNVPVMLGQELLRQAELVKINNGTKKEIVSKIIDSGVINVQIYNEEEIELTQIQKTCVWSESWLETTNLKNEKSTIETKLIPSDETPIYQKQRWLAPLEVHFLIKQVRRNYLAKYIWFASPVLLVKKNTPKGDLAL